MTTVPEPASPELTREQIDAMTGPALLEFGASWCGYCLRAQPLIAEALARHPAVPHLKVEDGPERPLGRSFGVTLWPTLVFLRDGREVTRLERPYSVNEIETALEEIDPPA